MAFFEDFSYIHSFLREYSATILSSIANLSETEFLVVCAFLIIIALTFLYFTFAFLKRTRLIEDMPTSKIRSAAQGYVELDGTQWCLKDLQNISLLSKTPCTWYHCITEKLETRWVGKKREQYWQVIDDKISKDYFMIDDGTGKCVVDPKGACIFGGKKTQWYGSNHKFPMKKSFWFISRNYRFTELLMLPGMPIFAIGMFHSVGALTADKNRQKQVLSLVDSWKKDFDALLAKFDINQDEKLSKEENAQVIRAAEEAIEKHRHTHNDHDNVHILSNHGILRRPFILSTISQTKLIWRSRWKAILFFLCFTLFTTLILKLWNLRGWI